MHNASPRRQSVALQRRFGDHQHGGGTITCLTRHRGSNRAARRKGLELSHRLQRRVTNRLVNAQVIHWNDFALKDTAVCRRTRPEMGLQCKSLHLIAAQRPFVGNHLCGAELGHQTVAVALPPANTAGEGVIKTQRLAGQHRRRNRDATHRLHAPGHHDVHRSRHDRLGCKMHRLLGRATLSINRRARHRIG